VRITPARSAVEKVLLHLVGAENPYALTAWTETVTEVWSFRTGSLTEPLVAAGTIIGHEPWPPVIT